MDEIGELLNERKKIYGDFSKIAHVSQLMKVIVTNASNWDRMCSEHREAMEFIVNKIARIIEGADLTYADSWRDIAGYAMLAVQKIERNEK